ncbi:lytic polysaccharide monooxygenase [Luedemannella flava]
MTVLTPSGALAHGAMMKPGSRTYNCWLDGLTQQGDIQPKNPACAAAVAAGGTTPLYNWFGVLRGDAAGRTTGYIADGNLCSGGNPTFAAYDAARSDWPLTHLTAGANFNWWYSNWAAHPGTWYMYVTRDGFNPNSPLKWSDLESQPFLTVTNPPAQGAVGTNDGHYYWSGNLPSGKSGQHIIYSRWVRSDSAENFFGCSDVVFDGGNGQVTGIGTGSGPTSAAPTTRAPSSAAPTSRPPTSAAPTTRAPSSAAPTSRPPTSAAPTSGPTGGGGCVATYKTVGQWSNGFQGEVTVKNNGSTTTSAWTATVTSPSGQTVTQVWSGTGSSSGSVTTVRNASWNGSLGGGASTVFGFLGTISGSFSAPTVTCVLS